MCKLLAIVDIENQDKALEFSELAVKPMTAKDDDGLGLIMMGDQGLGVERWLNPDDFPNTQSIPATMAKYAELMPLSYSSDGALSQRDIYAIGVHSRMATTPKCLANVHPFVRDNLALIHNGIISNHETFDKKVSTCDSEALLSLYIQHNVKEQLNNVQFVCDEVEGYYAFMVFDPANQTVTIVKDSRASLYFAHVSTVGIVFSTSDDILRECAGKMLKKKIEVFQFPSDTVIRWTKDAPQIQTLELEPLLLETKWVNRGNSCTSVEDSTKLDDAKCSHNVRTGLFCRECMDSDYPKYLTQYKGR
jgi:hypothetical protein